MTDGCARRNTTWLRPVVTSYNTTLQQFNTSIIITKIFTNCASALSLFLHSMHILPHHHFFSQFLPLGNPRSYFPYVRFPFKQNLTRRRHAAFTTITIHLQHYTTNDNIFIITLTNYHFLHQFFCLHWNSHQWHHYLYQGHHIHYANYHSCTQIHYSTLVDNNNTYTSNNNNTLTTTTLHQ